jgi:hypothetical protein
MHITGRHAAYWIVLSVDVAGNKLLKHRFEFFHVGMTAGNIVPIGRQSQVAQFFQGSQHNL